VSNVYGLTWAVLDCDENTTLDDFGSGILVKDEGYDYFESKSERKRGEVWIIHASELVLVRLTSDSFRHHQDRPGCPIDARQSLPGFSVRWIVDGLRTLSSRGILIERVRGSRSKL
jgi:hypothetical protein